MAAQSRKQPDSGVGDALRAAIDRTLSMADPARVGAPGVTRERATQLLDEVAKLGRDAREELSRRGQGARDELTRRGQDAGAELARRGQGAAEELAQRLEAFEQRLADLEDALRKPDRRDRKTGQTPQTKSKPKAES